jgi:hypothetical protein
MITYILREGGQNCTPTFTQQAENRLNKMGGVDE